MRISREPTAINRSFLGPFAAIATVVLVQCSQDPRHEENVSNLQHLRDISTKISRHGGSCSDPEKGAVFVSEGVVGYSGIGSGDLSFRLWSQNGAVFGVKGQGDFSNGLGEISLSPKEIPEFLSRAEAATRVLCTNTPSPLPNSPLPSSSQDAGLVTLGFFGQGVRING